MRFPMFGRNRKSRAPSDLEPLSALTVSGVEPTTGQSLGRRKSDLKFDRLYIPSMALDYSFLLLRSQGINGREKFIAWAGLRVGADAVVTTVINPRAAAGKTHGEIPADVVARVFHALSARDLLPLAQVHTHPSGAEISTTDRERSMVAINGFWSVILPDFAFGATTDATSWGVYEYESLRTWRALAPSEVVRRLVIDDSI